MILLILPAFLAVIILLTFTPRLMKLAQRNNPRAGMESEAHDLSWEYMIVRWDLKSE